MNPQLMHHSKEMRERMYSSYSRDLNNQQASETELRNAAKAMHHTSETQEQIYVSKT
jgi:hypothetical protein